MSFSVWVKDMFGATRDAFSAHSVSGLLFFYFYGLVFGALAAFVGAFLLRQLMVKLRCKTPVHWAVAGAILAPVTISLFGLWGRHTDSAQHPWTRLFELLTLGPKTLLEAGWWVAIPAGAATAYLLCRVQRAFKPQPEPQTNA